MGLISKTKKMPSIIKCIPEDNIYAKAENTVSHYGAEWFYPFIYKEYKEEDIKSYDFMFQVHNESNEYWKMRR